VSDRLNFQEACRELQISEDELEKLVASGEIASVKEGDTFYFKADVIKQYKGGQKSDPGIILSEDGLDLLDSVEEINLDELDLDASGDASAEEEAAPDAPEEVSAGAVEEIGLEDLEIPEFSLEDAAVGSDTESLEDSASEETPAGLGGLGELDLEEVSLSASSEDEGDDTVLNLDGLLEGDGGASEATTPVPGGLGELDLGDAGDDITLEGSVTEDTILDTDVLELTDEDDELVLDGGDELTEGATSSLIRGGGARVMQMKRVKGHPLWTSGLMITAILMVLPVAVLLNIFHVDRSSEVSSGKQSTQSSLNFLEDLPVRSTFESLAGMTAGLTED